jgi:methionyl-tRNA synthetase
MIERYTGGTVPAGQSNVIDQADASDLTEYISVMDGSRGYLLHEALRIVWKSVTRANEYAQQKQPWSLAKQPGSRAEVEQVLASLVRQLARLAVVVSPFMPLKAQELWESLGGPDAVSAQRLNALQRLDPAGWRVTKGPALFPREQPTAKASSAV